MADEGVLTVSITETVFLNSNYRNSSADYTVTGVTGIDNRIVTIPTGSAVELARFTSSLSGASAGTIVYDSLAYMRVTNLETTGSATITLSGVSGSVNTVEVGPKQSYVLNNTHISGSAEQLSSVKIQAVSTQKNIEYYIATK